MYNVLIVDDDQFTLNLLGDQLKSYGDLFTPIYVNDGQKAIDILDAEKISLLVTDLVMPGEFDGWAIVDHIEKKQFDIPCIVITSCEEEERLQQVRHKVRHLFYKPVQIQQLVESITAILNEGLAQGSLQGVSAVSFLQLLEMEGKTCLLEISESDGKKGLLYISKGTLYDAMFKDLRGLEAAYRLIAMDTPKLQIKTLPRKKIRRRIEGEMMGIIMEAMRLKDEAAEDKQNTDNQVENKTPVSFDEVESATGQPSMEKAQTGNGQDDQQAGETTSPPTQKENNTMSMEATLEELRSIKGYKAAALMNYTGEVLAADSIDEDVDLDNVGAVFNDIFRSSHEAAGKVGLKVCTELTMKTPDGLIIMSCSGLDAAVHFHLIAILDKDGNQALAKMQLDKMIPKMLAELS